MILYGCTQNYNEIGAIDIKKGKFEKVRSQNTAEEKAAQAKTGNKKQKTIAIIVSAVALVLVAALGIGIWFFMDATKDDGLIYSNVYAAGLNLGGMTPEQAREALEEVAGDTYGTQSLSIRLPDTTLFLKPEDTGVSLDVDALLDAAYAYGREGSRWERAQARADAALTSCTLDLEGYLILDQEALRGILETKAEEVRQDLVPTEVRVEGEEVPNLKRTIEEAEADEDVVHKTLVMVKGQPQRTLNVDTLLEQVLAAYHSCDFTPIEFQYDIQEPEAVDLKKIYDENYVAPIDVIIDEAANKLTAEVLGYEFDLTEAQKLLEEAEDGQEITLSFRFKDAEKTMKNQADLIDEKLLYQDVLASYSSNHVYNPNRTRNLELACNAINGTILQPGDVFSFNRIVGERTAAKGYKPATIYAGTESVESEGGGVCQVASTIYYCAMMADLEIVEREEHQFMVDYVPRGMDATIYWGSYDFKFRNNTGYPMQIYASTHGGQCHIVLYGTDARDTYVKMTYETVKGPIYEDTEYKEFTKDNNPKGYTDGEVIQTSYAGYTIKTYRHRYEKGTDKLISTTLEATSVFSSRPKIIAKLVEEETQPTEPPTTEPPTTTTPPTTQPPTTEPPTTEPPTTEPPTTEPPTTEPPTTEPPTTEPPTTEPPTDPSTDPTEPSSGEGQE